MNIQTAEYSYNLMSTRACPGRLAINSLMTQDCARKSAFTLAILMALCTAICRAQYPAPTEPTNVLTMADPIGLPPQASTDGTSEQVDLANGSLNMFIPAVTLPQRGGHPLVLGFTYNSNQFSLQQLINAGSQTLTTTDDYTVDYFTYTAQSAFTKPFSFPLQVNLPILTASFEYEGDMSITGLTDSSCTNTLYNTQTCIAPEYCLTNFSFTDWGGNTHMFNLGTLIATYACSDFTMDGSVASRPASYVTTIESNDGDFYTLDLRAYAPTPPFANGDRATDITVTAADGTIYKWSRLDIPQVELPTERTTAVEESAGEQYLNLPPSSITDPNGNTITIMPVADQNGTTDYKIVDTLGRQLLVSPNYSSSAAASISYTDSDGNSQSVTLQETSETDTSVPPNPPVGPYLGSDSCNIPAAGQSPPEPQYTLYIQSDYQPSSPTYPLIFTITYSATGRQYSLDFDDRNHLTKIRYPSGGYRRYDYHLFPYGEMPGALFCSWGIAEVNHRYECSSSSGSCSPGNNPEQVTTYSPGPSSLASPNPCPTPFQPSVTVGGLIDPEYVINSFNTVTDPLGTVTTHCFAEAGEAPGAYPVEYYSLTADSGGNKIQSVLTELNVYGWPLNVTTTQLNVTPNISSVKHYEYDTYTDPVLAATQYPIANPPGALPIDNDISVVDKDFNGNVLDSRSSRWYYTDHVLHLLNSSTTTDSLSGNTISVANSFDTKGNLQAIQKSGTNAVTQSTTGTQFDQFGRATTVVDGRGMSTRYSYADSWADSNCAPVANSQAYLTKVTNALSQNTSYSYYSCTGLLASVTDANGKTTSYTYDPLGRLTNVAYPDNGWTQNSYTDTAPNSVDTTDAIGVHSKVILDGLSRTSQKQLISDPLGTDFTDTAYDAVGRVASVSNPYHSRLDVTYGTTQFFYDALDRKTQQIQADGSSKQWWCYDGAQDVLHPQPNCRENASSLSPAEWVDGQDENGNDQQDVWDALDHLRSVIEPGARETDYTYDAFGNLWNVNQMGASGDTARPRSFIYNGLSQLITSTNTETGTVCYGAWSQGNCSGGYDADGNLVAKTDARGVTTSYGYDHLNRLISKTYGGNAPSGSYASCYQFDTAANGLGRLGFYWTQAGNCPSPAPGSPSGLSYQSLRVFEAYDAMGRVTSEQQCTLGFCTSSAPPPPPSPNCASLPAASGLTYCYDLGGDLTAYSNGLNSTAFPQQNILFSQTFDTAGRLASVGVPDTLNTPWVGEKLPACLFDAQSASSTTQWCPNVPPQSAYSPFGQLTNWFLGNNLNVNRNFDVRLRTTGEKAVQQ